MSKEQASKSLFWDSSEMMGAQASKKVLKIRCKFFLVYLETKSTVAGIIVMKKFTSGGPIGWSKNLSFNL